MRAGPTRHGAVSQIGHEGDVALKVGDALRLAGADEPADLEVGHGQKGANQGDDGERPDRRPAECVMRASPRDDVRIPHSDST